MEAEPLEPVALIRLAHLWAILNPQESYYNHPGCRKDVATGRPYFFIDPVLEALEIEPANVNGESSPQWNTVFRWMYGHD